MVTVIHLEPHRTGGQSRVGTTRRLGRADAAPSSSLRRAVRDRALRVPSRSSVSPRSAPPSRRCSRATVPARAGRRRCRPAARCDVPRRRSDRRARAVGPGLHRCRRQRRRHRHRHRAGREPEGRRQGRCRRRLQLRRRETLPPPSPMLSVTARSSAASSPGRSLAPIRRSPPSTRSGSSASLRTPGSCRSRSTTPWQGVEPGRRDLGNRLGRRRTPTPSTSA